MGGRLGVRDFRGPIPRPKALSLARRLLLPPLSPLLNLPPLLLTRTPPFTRLTGTADR